MAESFINMAHELTEFQEVLHTPRCRVILVKGEAGMGKSTLLTRFREIAEQQQVPCALVNFRPPADHGPLSVIYQVAELMGAQACTHLQDVQQALAAQTPTVVVSDIRAMFSSRVNIQVAVNSFSSELNQRNHQDRESWHLQFTAALFTDLAESRLEQAILCMDTYEACSETVATWTSTHLLPTLREQKKLKIVIAGEDVPHLDAEWSSRHMEIHLSGIGLAHWQEYLDQQRDEAVDPKHVEAAYMLYDGRPIDMVSATETFRRKAPSLCRS